MGWQYQCKSAIRRGPAEGPVTGPLAGPKTRDWSLREQLVPFLVSMTGATMRARLSTLGSPPISQVQEDADGR